LKHCNKIRLDWPFVIFIITIIFLSKIEEARTGKLTNIKQQATRFKHAKRKLIIG